MAQSKRNVVIVLGMHRSGTSLAANVLHSLGVCFGDDLLQARPDNPLGLWEHRQIMRASIEINRLLNRAPITPAGVLAYPVQWQRDSRISAARASLKQIVAAEIGKSPGVWGFKDPHAMRMVALWQELFVELGIDPVWMLSIRNPASVAASLTRRDGIDPAQAELLWLMHYTDAIRDVGDDIACVIEYERWFSDPHTQLEMVNSVLERHGLDRPTTTQMQDALEAIHPELWNQRREHCAVGGTSLVSQAYAALHEAAVGGDTSRLANACAEWRSAMNVFAPWSQLAADATALNLETLRVATKLSPDTHGATAENEEVTELLRGVVSRLFPAAGDRGRLYNEAGLYGLACDAYQAVVEKRPDQPWAWHSLATACLRAERYDEAVRAIKQAIVLSPREAAHHGLLAKLLMNRGDYGEAAAAFMEAAQLPSGGAAHFWHQAGSAFFQAGDLGSARHALDQCVSIEPRRAEIRATRGRVFKHLGLLDASAQEYVVACELDPGNKRYEQRLRDVRRLQA